MEQDRALGIVSLARRARKIELGEAPVGALARSRRARLILVAQDASPNTLHRVQHFVAGTRQPYLTVPYDKTTLGGAMGYGSCAMAAFSDTALALSFVEALNRPEQDAALLSMLRERAQRMRQRAARKPTHHTQKRKQ